MEHVLVIAEAGVNHNGKLSIAKQLVDAAKDAGADIVKFQTFNPEAISSKFAEMAQYQKDNMGVTKSQKEMLSELTLSHDDFIDLFEYCNHVGIRFLSTPFDISSITFLKRFDCGLWKIPSGEITNYPYLVEIAKTGQDIILSTGMSSLDEIHAAIDVLQDNNSGRITLLHCTTQYPTPYKYANLNAIQTLRTEFDLEVGYSDHTNGIEIPIAAVGMGAAVIEKHFTLNRNMEGPDHKASLEPGELKEMVTAIRHIEEALGDGRKVPSKVEIPNIKIARKSIVAACKISKGDILTEKNITTKRPGNGINPMLWPQILGSQAIRDFEADELIEI